MPVVNDEIDEVDELFVLLLELVSAENPDRVDLSERNISLARINDDDGECDCVCEERESLRRVIHLKSESNGGQE